MIKQQLWADVYKHLLFKNGDAKQAVFEADEAVKDFEERWSNKCHDCGAKIGDGKLLCFGCAAENRRRMNEAIKKEFLPKVIEKSDPPPYTGNGDNISVKLDEAGAWPFPKEGELSSVNLDEQILWPAGQLPTHITPAAHYTAVEAAHNTIPSKPCPNCGSVTFGTLITEAGMCDECVPF